MCSLWKENYAWRRIPGEKIRAGESMRLFTIPKKALPIPPYNTPYQASIKELQEKLESGNLFFSLKNFPPQKIDDWDFQSQITDLKSGFKGCIEPKLPKFPNQYKGFAETGDATYLIYGYIALRKNLSTLSLRDVHDELQARLPGLLKGYHLDMQKVSIRVGSIQLEYAGIPSENVDEESETPTSLSIDVPTGRGNLNIEYTSGGRELEMNLSYHEKHYQGVKLMDDVSLVFK